MLGLRKKIKGLNLFDGVATLCQGIQITHLSGWIAGNVNYSGWLEVEELMKELCARPLRGGSITTADRFPLLFIWLNREAASPRTKVAFSILLIEAFIDAYCTDSSETSIPITDSNK